MTTLRINITDFEKWGKLVKTWATGSNTYLKDGASYPIPTSLSELKYQMEQAGAGTVPDNIKAVQFITMTEETLLVPLPPKDAVEAMEQQLLDGAPYPLPAFYPSDWNIDQMSIDDKLKFNAERLGEYTINYCA